MEPGVSPGLILNQEAVAWFTKRKSASPHLGKANTRVPDPEGGPDKEEEGGTRQFC